MFDRARVIEISGVVKEFLWTNPHASFKVEVVGPEGKTQLWFVEMNGVANLVHEGWKRSTIKPGDQVTATINPLRDGRPEASSSASPCRAARWWRRCRVAVRRQPRAADPIRLQPGEPGAVARRTGS